MKPLLPEIANSHTFIHAAESEVKEYAASASVVAQLTEALESWISHSNEVIANLDAFTKNCESDCRVVDVADDLICDIATALKRLELESSFFSQFETKAVIAIRKVLQLVPNTKEKLEQLDKNLERLKSENKLLGRSRELFSLLDSYCARDSSWTLLNCEDTLPPLFCSLRAVFICCPLFGKHYPLRFSSLIRCVVKKIESLIRGTLPSLLSVSALSDSVGNIGIDQAVNGCLAAQSACISVQEEFYKLRISVAEAVTREFTSVIYEGINEETFFSRIDFYYDRCVIILQLLSVIKKRKAELFMTSGGLCEKVLGFDLLSPDDEVITHEELIDAIRAISHCPSTRPKDIIGRIEARASEHQEQVRRKERDSILQAAEEAATGRKHQYLLKQQQQRIKERERQEQEELEQQLSLMKKAGQLVSSPSGDASSSSTTIVASSAHQSRVADSNDVAGREWSIKYGDQREQLALLSDRDPYYSIVFAFNPPRILILGIPLKQKQLETLAVRFQDALRSRVLHTAEKIRQNKLSPDIITTSSHILKRHYEKFRSAAEELADARYEAHERSFKSSTAQHQLAQIHSQMMAGFSSSSSSGGNTSSGNYNNHQNGSANNFSNNSNSGQSQLEIELLQLRRFHVAAAHSAYMLDLPSSTTITDDDDTLQSYAVQAVLDTLEIFETSSSTSSSSTNNSNSMQQLSNASMTSGNINASFGSPSNNGRTVGGSSFDSTMAQESTTASTKEQQQQLNNELASTLAYTDDSGVHWSFFIFRYLPAMPKSRRERKD